jgi:hypothetical protein
MINKELLSEVLNKPVTLLRVVEDGTDYLASIVYTEHGKMNIYELAHKCKEWAVRQGYYLTSKQAISHITNELCYKVSIEPTEYHTYTLVGDTEPGAIFNACQWILENK